MAKVATILKGLPTEDQSLLMELLDLQWTVVVEQLGLINRFKENPSHPGRVDAAMARLQINSNIRREHGLRDRDMRSALLKIQAGDLLDHIEAVKGRA